MTKCTKNDLKSKFIQPPHNGTQKHEISSHIIHAAKISSHMQKSTITSINISIYLWNTIYAREIIQFTSRGSCVINKILVVENVFSSTEATTFKIIAEI